MSRGPSLQEIAKALNDDAHLFAPQIIGEEPNKSMSTRVEMRFRPKGGLRVHIEGPKKGKWSDYGGGGGGYGDMIDLIMYAKSMTRSDAISFAKTLLGIENGEKLEVKPRESQEEIDKKVQEDLNRRLRIASLIWSSSKPKLSANAIAHLQGRAIATDSLPSCIRYRKLDTATLVKMKIETKGQPPRFPNGLEAICYGAQDKNGKVAAVQQVILDGVVKADIANKKRTNGVQEEAAVKFAMPVEALDVAEGPETAFSCFQATNVATWAALGASNFTRIPVPQTVKRIRFACEIEESQAGVVAGLKAAYYWMTRGKDVELPFPRIGSDMNDVHQRAGIDAVREDMETGRKVEHHPFRAADGELLPQEAIDALPLVLVSTAEEALAVWQATGLGTIPILGKHNRIGFHLPENVKNVIQIVVGAEEEGDLQLDPKIGHRVLRIQHSLASLYETAGGEVLRRLIDLASPAGALQPFGVEELALHPKGPVIMVTGRGSMDAARELFPGSPVLGFSVQADAVKIDWSILKERDVLFAPCNHQDHILAAEEAGARTLDLGARAVRVVNWPLIMPMTNGWKSMDVVPEGYDLRWLRADGWLPTNMRNLIALSTRLEQAPAGDAPRDQAQSKVA